MLLFAVLALSSCEKDELLPTVDQNPTSGTDFNPKDGDEGAIPIGNASVTDGDDESDHDADGSTDGQENDGDVTDGDDESDHEADGGTVTDSDDESDHDADGGKPTSEVTDGDDDEDHDIIDKGENDFELGPGTNDGGSQTEPGNDSNDSSDN